VIKVASAEKNARQPRAHFRIVLGKLVRPALVPSHDEPIPAQSSHDVCAPYRQKLGSGLRGAALFALLSRGKDLANLQAKLLQCEWFANELQVL
jgi:hypothetical protein